MRRRRMAFILRGVSGVIYTVGWLSTIVDAGWVGGLGARTRCCVMVVGLYPSSMGVVGGSWLVLCGGGMVLG